MSEQLRIGEELIECVNQAFFTLDLEYDADTPFYNEMARILNRIDDLVEQLEEEPCQST